VVLLLVFTFKSDAVSGVLEQTLTHEPAKVRQTVCDSGGVFVKADGFVMSHDTDQGGRRYMYVCIIMSCVGLSAPVTCNALSAA
jgi:hypothetical protein